MPRRPPMDATTEVNGIGLAYDVKAKVSFSQPVSGRHAHKPSGEGRACLGDLVASYNRP